jgi:dipeptidyl aminopeptidase/acylaminoacyl peptidase
MKPRSSASSTNPVATSNVPARRAPPKRALDARTLWRFGRIGGVALAGDGRRAVCALTHYNTDDNSSRSALWLLCTAGGAPRQLTHCGQKDGQAAWSPRGDRIAFVARREQQGRKDDTPQLYLIHPDGGEAQRAGSFGPGVESFKWLPDGRRIVFAAWVWPGLKGVAAQNKAQQAHTERKETGYATSQALYRYWDHNIPQDRVLHLLLLDTASGAITDLFEGTAFELPRECDSNAAYDVHPGGQRLVFAHDPAATPCLGQPQALTEVTLRGRRFTRLVQDADWDFALPRYSPCGRYLAAAAAQVGRAHTALNQPAVVDLASGRWRALGAGWDHSVDSELRWAADSSAVYFSAEERGRCHLWRHDLASGRFSVAHPGGTVQGFDVGGKPGADVLLVAADSALHPTRVHAVHPGAAPLRLEHFNDDILRGVDLGTVQEVSVKGALGDPVQMWLTFPPGFKPRRKHAVTHVIHGGPYAAAGDTFPWRWNPHVLAAAGQVIAQVNFHGSSGFGWAFKHSLIGRQGELELQDIEAGTDWLLQQPWADASRICATGGSYGGFLVAWMNGHVPAWPEGRYRAYVCHAGVFDRIATFSADSYPVRPKDLAAQYWLDMPRVLAQSPHAFAAHMDTPTLVIHGAKDYRVPDCNGLAYYNTLKARGVDARLLWFPDENHWVLKPRNSLLWYAEFLAWLAAHTAAAPRRGTQA